VGDGRWKAGQSGNPRGRPPNDEWTAWFAAAQWTAFCALLRNARQGGNLPASNAASIYITDRNMGRPVQQVDATVTHDLAHQHLLAVAQLNGVPIVDVLPQQAEAAAFNPAGPIDPYEHELPLFDGGAPLQTKPPPEPPELADTEGFGPVTRTGFGQ
jgi:hypothetical protein